MIKVIEQYSDIWGECPTDEYGIMRLIEAVGRICWRSEGKTTGDSCYPFVDMLVGKEHLAMIEHSNLVVKTSYRQYALDASNFIKVREHMHGYMYAGNLRAYMEALGMKHPLEVLAAFKGHQVTNKEDIPLWAKRFTVKFVTDRAVTHEFVRHRPASFGQMSQRYVDHRKVMEFILPSHYVGKQNSAQYDTWYKAMEAAAEYYTQLREYGEIPQQARKVLPNSIRTEIAVTADQEEWDHIFKLRVSPAADQQIRELIEPVKNAFVDFCWTSLGRD